MTECLISYQEHIQEQIATSDDTAYKVSEKHKWCILTSGILDIDYQSIRTIIVSLDELPYSALFMKLQELAREDIRDPNMALEIQREDKNIVTTPKTGD